jgi:endonuclease I
LIRQRRSTLALFFAAALVCRFALADAYDPPSDYYDYATGNTGTILKQRLRATIDPVDDAAIPNTAEVLETPQSYDAARSSLQVTDAAPGMPGYMLSVYDRTPIHVAAINPTGSPPGWDAGATWNREHTWPRSRGVGSSGPDDSDLFELRPSLTSSNGSRADLNFGGAYGAQSYGTVTDGGQTFWYPGNADAGIIARQEFYMAVRYDGSDGSTQDLEIGTGNVANPVNAEDPPPQLGNLTRLLEWNYAAAPDTFERNRNQVIFTSYQHNRNPFTDHPEWVWSVFKDQANHSQVSIAGATVGGDGSSTKNVNLGRVFVGGAVPAAQLNTLNKAGDDGTYYSVATSGLATSSVSGRFNAFAITSANTTVTKSINIGLSTVVYSIQTTATAGVKSGTVTVDNLDITTGGGGGKGANDGDDTFNVSLNVLDHMTPSFSSPSLLTSSTLDFGNIAIGSGAPTLNFDVFDLNGTVGSTANMDFDSFTPLGSSAAFTTNLGGSAGSLQIAAGTSQTFAASLNLTSVGTFTAMYTLNFSDENLTGAQNKSVTLTLTGKIRLAGDFNNDGSVDAGDYVVWQHSFGESVTTAYSGADGDGNLTIDNADFDVWRAHFGQTAAGSGTSLSLSAAVPEPATTLLAAFSAAIVCHCLRRTR